MHFIFKTSVFSGGSYHLGLIFNNWFMVGVHLSSYKGMQEVAKNERSVRDWLLSLGNSPGEVL